MALGQLHNQAERETHASEMQDGEGCPISQQLPEAQIFVRRHCSRPVGPALAVMRASRG